MWIYLEQYWDKENCHFLFGGSRFCKYNNEESLGIHSIKEVILACGKVVVAVRQGGWVIDASLLLINTCDDGWKVPSSKLDLRWWFNKIYGLVLRFLAKRSLLTNAYM